MSNRSGRFPKVLFLPTCNQSGGQQRILNARRRINIRILNMVDPQHFDMLF